MSETGQCHNFILVQFGKCQKLKVTESDRVRNCMHLKQKVSVTERVRNMTVSGTENIRIRSISNGWGQKWNNTKCQKLVCVSNIQKWKGS